jgi:CRISPR-associated endonuclease/helicase Cas3
VTVDDPCPLPSGHEDRWRLLDALWGKQHEYATPGATADGADSHPLLFHMLDVAAVTELLWEETVGPLARRRIAAALGLDRDEDGARRLVGFLAALHDLGKASPGFVRTVPHLAARAEAAGLVMSGGLAGASHERIGAGLTLGVLTGAPFGWSAQVATEVASAVSLDGGRSIPRSGVLDPGLTGLWPTAVRCLLAELTAALEPPVGAPGRVLPPEVGVVLAGLVKVADWIGSQPQAFPYTRPEGFVPRAAYWEVARERARAMVDRIRLRPWRAPDVASNAVALFGVEEARPVQQAAAERAAALFADGPGLLIVEDVMGSGKTEAGWLFAHAARRAGARGFYMALPTRATSNQSFTRMADWFADVCAGERPILLHGYWRQHTTPPGQADGAPDPAAVMAGARSEMDRRTQPSMWFRGRYRGLLAAVGVGTVDQILAAGLAVKYGPVRLFGLHERVLIIDEVHAYDTYMTGLLTGLLRWAAALGCPVVILSATLPVATRRRLVAAYREGLDPDFAVEDLDALSDADLAGLVPEVGAAGYPRTTVVDRDGAVDERAHAISLDPRTVDVVWSPLVFDAAGAAGFAAQVDALTAGARWGRLGVICNSVPHAQAVAAALRTRFVTEIAAGRVVVDLLHARFLIDDRARIEQRIQAAHDKTRLADRHETLHITVGTQVLEQSLDVDFDLLVTEFAPTDLLLQRIGRLWRWWRANPTKPQPDRPAWAGVRGQVWIADPYRPDTGLPDFRTSTAIYARQAPATLWASWLAWHRRSTVHLPDDLDPLVQNVYTEHPGLPVHLLGTRYTPTPEQAEAWEERYATARQAEADALVHDTAEALSARAPSPHEDNAWRTTMGSAAVRDDETDTTAGHRVTLATRLDTGSVTVIFATGTTGAPVTLYRSDLDTSTLSLQGWALDETTPAARDLTWHPDQPPAYAAPWPVLVFTPPDEHGHSSTDDGAWTYDSDTGLRKVSQN